MTATVLPSPARPVDAIADRREAFPAAPRGLTIVTAAPGLWRVARTGGPVLGHIELRRRDGVERYAARRLLGGGIRSMELGEFWSPTDAAECFR